MVAESDKNARYVANLPTKDDYRKSSKIEFVSSGMESLSSMSKATSTKSTILG